MNTIEIFDNFIYCINCDKININRYRYSSNLWLSFKLSSQANLVSIANTSSYKYKAVISVCLFVC